MNKRVLLRRREKHKRDLSFVTSENQSRGSAVVKNGTFFTLLLDTCGSLVGGRLRIGRERVIRCPFIVSPLRMLGPTRAPCSRWLFSPTGERSKGGRGSGEGSLLPPSQRWLLPARSTWLIAGVILARLTFGIKWQPRSPPGEHCVDGSRLAGSSALSPGSINLDYKLRPLYVPRKRAREFFSLGPKARFLLPTDDSCRDHALFFNVARPLASA